MIILIIESIEVPRILFLLPKGFRELFLLPKGFREVRGSLKFRKFEMKFIKSKHRAKVLMVRILG
jgi:hypothetical protein